MTPPVLRGRATGCPGDTVDITADVYYSMGMDVIVVDRLEALGRVRAALEAIGAPVDHLDDHDLELALVDAAAGFARLGIDVVQFPDAAAAVGNALGGRI